MNEKKLFKKNVKIAQQLSLRVVQHLLDLEAIISSSSGGSERRAMRFDQTTNKIYNECRDLYSLCCRVSGRDYMEIPLYNSLEELTAAYKRGDV